nr:nuclear shuttle protein [Banana bunchy top virus]
MDWAESQFKTCTHGCDWKKISSDSADNRQYVPCVDSGAGRKSPRKKLCLMEASAEIRGTFVDFSTYRSETMTEKCVQCS